MPTKAALSLFLLNWTEEGKYKRLLGSDKDTYQLQSQANQTQFGEISFFY